MARTRKRSLADQLREVADGWRWGRCPVTPRGGEAHTPPAEQWSFPTDWARTPAGRAARDIVLSGVMKPIVWNETSPDVFGLDNLEAVQPPVMFISNHSSHLDATLILTTLPLKWRNKTATAAAKDYFFDVWWRSAFTALDGEPAVHERRERRPPPHVEEVVLGRGGGRLVPPLEGKGRQDERRVEMARVVADEHHRRLHGLQVVQAEHVRRGLVPDDGLHHAREHDVAGGTSGRGPCPIRGERPRLGGRRMRLGGPRGHRAATPPPSISDFSDLVGQRALPGASHQRTSAMARGGT